MLATDLTLNASTAIAAGTAADRVLSLVSQGADSRTVRAVAATALTQPQTLTISHSTRQVKGLKTQSNDSVAAGPVVFDRHLVRLDNNVTQSAYNDPLFQINRSVQLVIETPRLGASSPTATQIVDDLLAIVAMLRASTNANLVRILNRES